MRQCALSSQAKSLHPSRLQARCRRSLAPALAPQQPAARTHVAAQAGRHLFPFSEESFHRVCLVRKQPYGPLKMLPTDPSSRNSCSGVLVFKQEAELLAAETNVLEVFVSGDTAGNIYTLLNNHQYERPMVHDLMWNMMSQMANSNRQWQLLKVAIVALKDDVFIGRLFFGDPKTGEVMWDCDCRPSDGCYLHLKSGCPFYVSTNVWDQAAVPVRHSKVHLIAVHEQQMAQEQMPLQHSHNQQPGNPQGDGDGLELATSTQRQQQSPARVVIAPPPPAASEYASVKVEDPEPIKLLKRKLALAIAEEDYRVAVVIRDHPYMQMYNRIQAFMSWGKMQEAEDLEAELHGMIRRQEASEV